MEDIDEIIALIPEGASLSQFLRVVAVVAHLQPDENCGNWQKKLEDEVSILV
jgi:hypothetical protein